MVSLAFKFQFRDIAQRTQVTSHVSEHVSELSKTKRMLSLSRVDHQHDETPNARVKPSHQWLWTLFLFFAQGPPTSPPRRLSELRNRSEQCPFEADERFLDGRECRSVFTYAEKWFLGRDVGFDSQVGVVEGSVFFLGSL